LKLNYKNKYKHIKMINVLCLLKGQKILESSLRTKTYGEHKEGTGEEKLRKL